MRNSILRQNWIVFLHRRLEEKEYKNLSGCFFLAKHSVADNRNSYECFGALHDLILPFVSLPVTCSCFEKGPGPHYNLFGLSNRSSIVDDFVKPNSHCCLGLPTRMNLAHINCVQPTLLASHLILGNMCLLSWWAD